MQPAVFDRANPCTKVHIHNAFMSGGTYKAVPVIAYCSVAGVNSRKYLKREGYATEKLYGGVDYIELTPEGVQWLTEGLARHLELHPEDAGAVLRGSPAKPARAAKRIIRR